MRSDKELLIILRDNVEEHLCNGLCSLCTMLMRKKVINEKEMGILISTIANDKDNYYWSYYFPVGKVKPRIDYLNELINKHK